MNADVDGGLFDVGRHEEVVAMFDQVSKRFGTLDILVNNAGNLALAALVDLSEDQWDTTIRSHLYGTFFCTKEAVKRFFMPQRSGKIINVTSPAGVKGFVGFSDYAAAKGGIIPLRRPLRRS